MVNKIYLFIQDWGTYSDMEKLNELYMKNPNKDNWKYLIEQEKSNTKKQLEYYINESSNNKYSLDDVFITNAIMCARKGENYRGDNINLKKSTDNCKEHLLKQINSVKFNHAMHGSKMLFEQGLIKNFIEDRQYDEIIKKSIENHSKLEIEKGLDERTLLHSKIIRDADKLDNYRVKKEESIEAIFPTQVNKKEDMEESLLSDKVYDTVLNKNCVDIHDRVTPLDFWVCILAFTFDLNFDVTYKIVKENDYINVLIDRFDYKEAKERMENIREIINKFLEEKI